MAGDVTRYDLWAYGAGQLVEEEDRQGDWIRFEDHEATIELLLQIAETKAARLTALEQENKRLREALLKEFRINNMQSGMKREYAIVEAEHDLANLMRIKT